MATSLSILPLNYDIPFIIKKAGVVNHYGYETLEDGIHFKYQVSDYEKVQAVISAYPVDYLAVIRPIIIESLVSKRQEVVLNFSFNGIKQPLDQITQTNLAGAAIGLQRNESILQFDWHLGGGKFITLPRVVIFAMADMAFVYLQAAFTRQRELTEQVMAADDIFDLAAIDINTGWPDQT